MRDEDHKDVHPALPWSACTVRAGTRGLAVCGWAAESPIIALRKMPEALCVASLRHVVVCRVQRPPLVCSDLLNNWLTGSIPPQLSSLNKLTYLCVHPCSSVAAVLRGMRGDPLRRTAGVSCAGTPGCVVEHRWGSVARLACVRHPALMGRRPSLLCSNFFGNRLTGSIPLQMSLLNQLSHLCVHPCGRVLAVRSLRRVCGGTLHRIHRVGYPEPYCDDPLRLYYCSLVCRASSVQFDGLGCVFVFAFGLMLSFRHGPTAAARVQRRCFQPPDRQHPIADVIAEQADYAVRPPMSCACAAAAWSRSCSGALPFFCQFLQRWVRGYLGRTVEHRWDSTHDAGAPDGRWYAPR